MSWIDDTQSDTTARNASRFISQDIVTTEDIDFRLKLTTVNPFYLTAAPDAQAIITSKNDPV